MREDATAASRKGPAKLASGDLDDMFEAKRERPAAPGGAAPRSALVPERPVPAAESEGAGPPKRVEKAGVSLSTIRIPDYLSERIANYLHVHRSDTMQTLFFKGLVKLGIDVEPDDLVPKRQRRMR
jgi:hypothetical protein